VLDLVLFRLVDWLLAEMQKEDRRWYLLRVCKQRPGWLMMILLLLFLQKQSLVSPSSNRWASSGLVAKAPGFSTIHV